MFDFVGQPWFVPAIIVIVGLPLVMIALTELHGSIQRRGGQGGRFVLFLRNGVAPVGALLILLAQTQFIGTTAVSWTKIIATVFGFLIILALLGGLNLVIFVTARKGSWRARVPSIFIEVVRVILIVVSLGVLFSVVWHADVGGLFAALGVGSIVIGLALQNAVGGIVSGLLLLSEAPFALGDWIVVNGIRGQVVEVNWRALHMTTTSGLLIVPNSNLASANFYNLTKTGDAFTNDIYVRFSTDDPPQLVMDVCTATAASLPMAIPGQDATISTMGKGKYEVEIPITTPALNGASIRMFNTRLWYAARRAGLHLDRDKKDPFQTRERLLESIRTFAGALYIKAAEVEPLAESVMIERYGEGEVIQRSMLVPDAMRYVISGTASLSYPSTSGDVVVETLSHASVLGLTALTRQPVITTAVALTDVAVLVVPVDVLDRLVKTRPDLARDIGVELDHRRDLADAALKAVGAPAPLDANLIA